MKLQLNTVVMKRVRESQGLSRSEVARRAGMAPTTVGWIESGRFYPYPSQLQKIADALGVDDPGTLLEIEEVTR